MPELKLAKQLPAPVLSICPTAEYPVLETQKARPVGATLGPIY